MLTYQCLRIGAALKKFMKHEKPGKTSKGEFKETHHRKGGEGERQNVFINFMQEMQRAA